MEMKYNSLKEALPSLLEEKARLEEEKAKLEARIVELKKQKEELDMESNYFFANLLLSLDKLASFRYAATGLPEEIIYASSSISWESSEFSAIEFKEKAILLMATYIKEKLLDEETIMSEEDKKEFELLLAETVIISEESGALLRAVDLVRTQKSELQSKELIELNYSLTCVNWLIRAAEDISYIVDADFKLVFADHKHLFDAAFNDMLDTNSLAWIYEFSKINHDSLSKENMKALIEKVIKTNIPAYMFLVAVKINNIPDEEMKRLIAAIVTSNDKKYIDYLLISLSQKGVSEEVKEFIISHSISISAENMFDYDSSLADKLKKALLEDNLEVLYKHGMYSYEDRAYVLSNIQAGL